jgi:polysaccharide biosynthesis/export protein
MRILLRVSSVFCAAFLVLSGCDLPQGAGRADQILAGADSQTADFAVQPVTRATLPMVLKWPVNSPMGTQGWIGRNPGSNNQIIEPGDRLDVTIWDNEQSSLLMSPGQKTVVLNGLQVSQKGTVFLPYVSEIEVANLSPDQARVTIQDRMVSLAPSVQVQVTHTSGKQNSVDVVSGVAAPGTVPLIDRNTTVLNVLTKAGGASPAIKNPQVRLMRDGALYGVSLDRLLKTPSMDTTLQGGDKLFIEEDERFFVTMGATGAESRISFPTDMVSAMDAVALSGGLNEVRANPAAIFILREYSANAPRTDGSGPQRDRMVFTFDLTSADGLFSAGRFPLQHRDIVIATESPVTAARTVLALLASALVFENVAN